MSSREALRSFLSAYDVLETGHSYDFNVESPPDRSQTGGPRKANFIPFVVTMVPPVEIPSGRTQTRKIPAPQQIETKYTTIGEENNVISVRAPAEDSETGAQRFRGVSGENPTPRDAGIEENDGSEGEAEGEEDEENQQLVGMGVNPDIQTEVSFRDLEAEDSFDNYLGNLEERYNDFEKAADGAQSRTEEENQDLVIGRDFEEDEFLRQSQKLQEARQMQEPAEFLRRQALLIRELPPLLMYINPTSFDISYDHVTTESKTREGHIVEHWGLEQHSIDCSGKVGAFYADKGNGRGGLTNANKRESAAYQSFMNLFMIYRQNGYIYNTQDRISTVGSVRILYDNKMYVGSFDEFSISESEDQPFTLEYDFTFTVRYEREME